MTYFTKFRQAKPNKFLHRDINKRRFRHVHAMMTRASNKLTWCDKKGCSQIPMTVHRQQNTWH